MNWIEELAQKRRAQKTNVFIVGTSDPLRISQFRKLTDNGAIMKLFGVKQPYKKVIEFNLQTAEITDLQLHVPLTSKDPMASPTSHLLEILRSEPTVLVVSYAFDKKRQDYYDQLGEFLAACANDERMTQNVSTIVVFCSDKSLFSAPLLNLAYTIDIPPSTVEERKEILSKLVAELKKGLGDKMADLKVDESVLQASSGLNLLDTQSAGLESFYLTRNFDVKVFTDYKVQILKNYGIEYVEPSRGFESVGGYDYMKHYIQTRIIALLKNPELAKKYGLRPPKGILIYGSPGTGKTYISKAFAKEIGLPMIKISPADLLRGIVGETESRVRQLTQIIETLAPVVVFIDEIDQLGQERGSVASTDSGVSRRMTNMLLEWLGGERQSFIVGATNLIEQMDIAMIRVGRIDEIIPMFPPDAAARMEILKVHTNIVRKTPLGPSIALGDIADATNGWTGAELEKLVLEASSIAMEQKSDKVEQKHFLAALDAIAVNTSEREKTVQSMISKLMNKDISGNVNKRFLKKAAEVFTEGDKSRAKQLLEAMDDVTLRTC